MIIRRDYNRPFFSKRRRGASVRLVLLIGMLMGAGLVVLLTQFDKVQQSALSAVGVAPTATPFASDLATQAMTAFLAGDVDQAAMLFERAIDQQPNNIDYLYEYGNILIEAEPDRSAEAVAVGEHMMTVAPNDPRGYALKARALMWTDETEAITTAIQGVDVDPNFAPLYAAQGVAYTNMQRLDLGVRNAERAAQLDPMNPIVQRALYTPYLYVGRYQDAIDALMTAISLQPNLTAPRFELAFIYALPQVGQPEMAVATYNSIIDMDPDNAKAYLRLCETYARVENADHRVAQPYCDEAIRIDPAYGPAYRETGRMQYVRRNYEGAIESFNECVSLGTDDIECYYLRGLAHYFLGDCEDAWAVLTESQTRAVAQNEGAGVMGSIDQGLSDIRRNCPGFVAVDIPTAPPPTALPPTPIGGGFG